MSMTMDDSIKRWTGKRKTALVIEIIQGKTTVAEAGGVGAGVQILEACVFVVTLANPAFGFRQGLGGREPGRFLTSGGEAVVLRPRAASVQRNPHRPQRIDEETIRRRGGVGDGGQPEPPMRMQGQPFIQATRDERAADFILLMPALPRLAASLQPSDTLARRFRDFPDQSRQSGHPP